MCIYRVAITHRYPRTEVRGRPSYFQLLRREAPPNHNPMRNRGPQPNDPALFAPKHFPDLTAATDDLCWLMSRNYGIDSAAKVIWYFDQPVSNSGRLKTMLRELSETHDFNWDITLAYNPDKELIALPNDTVLVSSDSWILDDGGAWCNLGRELLEGEDVWMVKP